MTQVFLYQNGQQVGPYQVSDLQNWIQSGQLNITDQAWFEGCATWVTLADVPGIILPQGGQGDRSVDVPPFEAYEEKIPIYLLAILIRMPTLFIRKSSNSGMPGTTFGMMREWLRVMNGLKKLPMPYLGVVSFFVSFLLGQPIQSIVETRLIWR